MIEIIHNLIGATKAALIEAKHMAAPMVLTLIGYVLFFSGGFLFKPEADSNKFILVAFLGLALMISGAVIYIKRDMGKNKE